MEKKLYFELSDNYDVSRVVMSLSECMTWIENDDLKEGHEKEYTITPVWMTEKKFNNLREACI